MTFKAGDRVVVVRMLEHGAAGSLVGRRGRIEMIADEIRGQSWHISVWLDGDRNPMWFHDDELEHVSVLDVIAEVSDEEGR